MAVIVGLRGPFDGELLGETGVEADWSGFCFDGRGLGLKDCVLGL